MRNNSFLYFTILCLTSMVSLGQLSDLARIEYVALPQSPNGGASLSRFRTLVNYPIQLKKEGSFIVVGADYRHISFSVDDTLIPFNPDELKTVKQLSFTFGYTYKINEDWRFGAQIQPGYSTNLKVGDITFDDAIISGNIVFIKDKKKSKTVKKPHRLIVGLAISGNGGFPVLPFISYFRKFHPKWSYNFGVPKTQLQYYISERNRLKLIAKIDGFTTRLQNDFDTGSGAKLAERFRQRLLLGGLRYEFKFTKYIEFYVNGSYIIDNSLELRDDERETLFEFEEDSSLYFQTGVRFKL